MRKTSVWESLNYWIFLFPFFIACSTSPGHVLSVGVLDMMETYKVQELCCVSSGPQFVIDQYTRFLESELGGTMRKFKIWYIWKKKNNVLYLHFHQLM